MAIVTKTIGTSSRDYSTITLWEADIDNTTYPSAGTDVLGECYDDSTFNEAVTINANAGNTDSITLSVASAERHTGIEGTGARIVRTSGTGTIITMSSNSKPIIVEWLEVDGNGNELFGILTSKSGNTARNNIVHGLAGSADMGGIQSGNQNFDVFNNLVYDIVNSAGGSAVTHGIHNSGGTARTYNYLNNTVFNIVGSGTGTVFGFNDLDNVAGYHVKNNIAMGASGGSGTIEDYQFPGTGTVDSDTNMSSDDTADDGGGSGHLISKTASSQFVSVTGGSEDLHLKSGADAIAAGTDLGTSPSGVQFDIDNDDRDTLAVTWDIGADQLVAAAVSLAETQFFISQAVNRSNTY